MKKKLILAAIASIGVIALAGCGSSSSSQQASSQASSGSDQGSGSNSSQTSSSDSNNTATASTTAFTGDATKGKDVFAQSCAGCHSTGSDQIVGPGLKGVTSQATIVSNGKPMNDANLIDWIKAGGTGKIGNMPGQGGTLTDQQISDVVAYLKTLQ